MSIRRVRSLVALAVLFAAPATSQAQFGKLMAKAKSIRSSVDSAKAVVDTGKTVVRSTKAVVTDLTSGIPDDSSAASGGGAADTSKGAGGAHAKARAGGPSATTAATAPGTSGAPKAAAPARRGAAAKSAPATPPSTPPSTRPSTPPVAQPNTPPATRAAPRSGGTPLTEAVYSEFARGAAAEKSQLKTNPDDVAGAISAGVAASGMNIADYASVHARVMMYAAYATGKKGNKTADVSKLFSAGDLAVLDAHSGDIIQMMPK